MQQPARHENEDVNLENVAYSGLPPGSPPLSERGVSPGPGISVTPHISAPMAEAPKAGSWSPALKSSVSLKYHCRAALCFSRPMSGGRENFSIVQEG